jgi:hypothetical protein
VATETLTQSRDSSKTLPWIAALLLIVGIQFWLVFAKGFWGRDFQLLILPVALLAAAIPVVQRKVTGVIDSLRNPSPQGRCWIAVVVSIIAAGYFMLTALLQQRDFAPWYSDDFSYLLQMRMLASGKLWLPAHPLATFFESNHIFVTPVYASMYFPGAAMLYVPAVWLHLPIWVLPVIVAAAVVGMTYRVIAEAVDGVAGLGVAVMLIALPWYRTIGLMPGSRIPVTLFGMIGIWAWMRWRKNFSWKWAMVIGGAMGWAAITRPLDALCFAVPIGAGMLFDLRKCRTLRTWITTTACVIAAAVPFLAVQLVFNHGVTGRWLRTPFSEYASRDYPQTEYGFHGFDPNVRPSTNLPQKLRMYETWVVPYLREHRPDNIVRTWMSDRFPKIGASTLPHPLFWILVPIGWLGLTTTARRVLIGVVPCFVIGYVFYPFFLEPYALMIAPIIATCVMLGMDSLRGVWPRWGTFITTFLTLSIVSLTIAQLPEFNRFIRDQEFASPFRKLDAQLAGLGPSLVFIDGSHPACTKLMAVYNLETPWPDDARVIRANDLGNRNVELIQYFASRSPRRRVYRYDLHENTLHELGWADELAAGKPSTP